MKTRLFARFEGAVGKTSNNGWLIKPSLAAGTAATLVALLAGYIAQEYWAEAYPPGVETPVPYATFFAGIATLGALLTGIIGFVTYLIRDGQPHKAWVLGTVLVLVIYPTALLILMFSGLMLVWISGGTFAPRVTLGVVGLLDGGVMFVTALFTGRALTPHLSSQAVPGQIWRKRQLNAAGEL